MDWHRNIHRWIGPHIAGGMKRILHRPPPDQRLHVMFCVADHFEPYRGNASDSLAAVRVKKWAENLPHLAEGIAGSDGKPYKHTFFYPKEEYSRDILDELSEIRLKGLGEVEIHIHHDKATSGGFRQDMLSFKSLLRKEHGLLSILKETDDIGYGFIHGNWALDNARPDGCWCGINDELTVLKETGCYADFTLPSAPSVTQTAKINSIYYAHDDPEQPLSHNKGRNASTGRVHSEDLLLVQGPLTLDWQARKKGIFPAIENGEIGGGRPPTIRRFELWKNRLISVKGRPEWIFIKVHCHGAKDTNAAMFFDGPMRSFLEALMLHAERRSFALHFVTAREMYNIIKAAEAGENSDPDRHRDYLLRM